MNQTKWEIVRSNEEGIVLRSGWKGEKIITRGSIPRHRGVSSASVKLSK